MSIGPGRFVLVVGPSGAGKDTLIALARAHCASDPRVVFPRRIVTRAATVAEDHDSISEAEFARLRAAGGFALDWQAHGLSYGLPAALDDDIRAGRTVVCNVSRAVVASARARYAQAVVVMITAPAEVLAQRLAQRGRESGAGIAERMNRGAAVELEVRPDMVIENDGPPDAAAKKLIGAIV
jgi:ribose 1,5-bisphosphokinase